MTAPARRRGRVDGEAGVGAERPVACSHQIGDVVKLQGGPDAVCTNIEASTTRLFGSPAMPSQGTTRLAECDQCGDQFERATIRQRFCGPRCSSTYHTALPGLPPYTPAYDDGLSFQTKGALSELRASVDLLGRGFHVYRSMSASAPWDLVVAIPSGRLVRVEVKSATVNKSGGVNGGSFKRNVFDAVCYVTRDRLVYEPPVEEW